jgi:hypothetical protein
MLALFFFLPLSFPFLFSVLLSLFPYRVSEKIRFLFRGALIMLANIRILLFILFHPPNEIGGGWRILCLLLLRGAAQPDDTIAMS